MKNYRAQLALICYDVVRELDLDGNEITVIRHGTGEVAIRISDGNKSDYYNIKVSKML